MIPLGRAHWLTLGWLGQAIATLRQDGRKASIIALLAFSRALLPTKPRESTFHRPAPPDGVEGCPRRCHRGGAADVEGDRISRSHLGIHQARQGRNRSV